MSLHLHWLAHRCFSLDPRSLAASRVVASFVLLYETHYSVGSWEAYAFLSDWGVWPRKAAALYPDDQYWSLHLISGSHVWVWVMHLGLKASAGLMLIGWYTREATFCCWLLWASTMSRCWPICSPFDSQLVHLLFYSFLGLNWGCAFSLDAVMSSGTKVSDSSLDGKQHPRHRLVFTAATICISIQTIVMYWSCALHKQDPSWNEGSAVQLALQAKYMARPISASLLTSSTGIALMQLASRMVRPLELYGPSLFIMPIWRLRISGILLFLCYHTTTAVVLRLDDLPGIYASVLLIFLPPTFWDGLRNCIEPLIPKPWKDRLSKVRFHWCVFVQHQLQQRRNGMNDLSTSSMEHVWSCDGYGCSADDGIEMVQAGRHHMATDDPRGKHGGSATTNSSMGIGVGCALWRWLCILGASLATLYLVLEQADIVSHSRHWFSSPSWMRALAKQARLNADSFFLSPRPPWEDWYMVFPATLGKRSRTDQPQERQTKNSFEVDLLPALFGDFEKPLAGTRSADEIEFEPKDFSYVLKNERWTKYLESFRAGWQSDAEQKLRTEMRGWLGKFLCREWNARFDNTDKELISFYANVYIMDNWAVMEDSDMRRPVRKETLWFHQCR